MLFTLHGIIDLVRYTGTEYHAKTLILATLTSFNCNLYNTARSIVPYIQLTFALSLYFFSPINMALRAVNSGDLS